MVLRLTMTRVAFALVKRIQKGREKLDYGASRGSGLSPGGGIHDRLLGDSHERDEESVDQVGH